MDGSEPFYGAVKKPAATSVFSLEGSAQNLPARRREKSRLARVYAVSGCGLDRHFLLFDLATRA